MLHHEKRGAVVVLTIDRPDVKNAIDDATAVAISDALDEAAESDEVLAVVFTGAGDDVFCSGADLKMMAAAGESERVRLAGGFAGVTRRVFPKPLIAALNGSALGGGFEIALACDLVVAADHAVLGLPEVHRGVIASGGGLIRLAGRMPPAIALELALTGRPITAGRAYALGLVNAVVPRGTALPAALELAMAVCEAAPVAVRISKRLVYETASMPLAEAWQRNRMARREAHATADALEGARAFTERRPPRWTGR